MMGVVSDATPTYPVSSLSSLTAACSAVSPSSTKPAGTSMQIWSMGGRYCFCRMISGPVGFSRMATMPTPSMSPDLGRVRRSADSQVRGVPFWSV